MMNIMSDFAKLSILGILGIAWVGNVCALVSGFAVPTEVITAPDIEESTETHPQTPTPVEALAAEAKTYYVRQDGGSSEECTGLVDAPYPGSGKNQPCAWSHPFYAFPPDGNPLIAGGDTLIIASGSYMMGYGAPDPEGYCEPDGAFGCYMSPVPSGANENHPTRVLGSGWDSGCSNPPKLWGTQRADMVLNLANASNIEVACLEITDHSDCVEYHGGDNPTALTCERDNYPFGEWTVSGIYAEDSTNVILTDLDIHGLAVAGVTAGRLTDWSVENVRIAANGWVGWEGDIDGNDSNSGTLLFRHWTVEWNGCAETYPGGEPTGCWAQSAGGYGDGVGTGATSGDWIIEDSQFLHNTSDGLDLLYHSLGGTVTLNRVHAEGNAGNQIKVTGEASITNSVLVGNCGYFEGKSFTYNVDNCRAFGNTLEVVYTGGETVSIVNATFYGQGDGLIGGGPREGFQCNGNERLIGWNNVFFGDEDYLYPGDITFLFYQEGCDGLTFEVDNSIAYQVKNIGSPYVVPSFPSAHNLNQDPQLIGPFSGSAYGMQLKPDSPAIDAGNNAVCPTVDFRGLPRPFDGDKDGTAVCDFGAYEWQEVVSWLFLPLTMKEN